jgi:hypothetical protein
MRMQPENRDWRWPGRWRGAGILAAAGLLSLAGCSTFDAGTTASAPDPFLGPAVASPPKVAGTNVQPPPGAAPKAFAGVLPAAPAPNSAVSVAALAPTSVHPTGDREDLRMGGSRTMQNGEDWTPTSSTSVASNGVRATLNQPETTATPTRSPAPALLTQNNNPAPTAQSATWPPPQAAQAATQTSPGASPDTTAHTSREEPPATIDAAAALLTKKGAIWQRPSGNGETGEVLFRCGIPNLRTNKVRTYEARARDQLSAMQAVIEQIDNGQ